VAGGRQGSLPKPLYRSHISNMISSATLEWGVHSSSVKLHHCDVVALAVALHA
jgi:hypothetical protein